MTGRHVHILDAAMRVFSRYGVGKTTMADIATEAGVARQTVYNAYPTKDDLMRAVVRNESMATEKAVLETWRSAASFDEKLEHFFEMGPLSWYDVVQQSPDAAALIDGIHRIAAVELQEAAVRWQGYFAQELETHFERASIDVQALADFIYSTAINAKTGAKNRTEVERRLSFLRRSIAALLTADQT